ncbi:MAG TPA: ABC transporter ATP-binding protein [Acidobacteriota bacterium]
MKPAILEVRGLSFTYRGSESPALDGIDLELAAGGFLRVAGATGAGKSTFCRCLNGLIPQFQRGELRGEVRIGGVLADAQKVGDNAARVGLVFQDFEAQLFSTSVEREVAFGPENLGLPREQIAQRVERSLAAVGLAELRRRDPATLSGGEKQKLALAATLALEPELLVLDEPTTDLDPPSRRWLRELLQPGRGLSSAVILAEPEIGDGAASGELLVLEAGRCAALGPAQRLARDTESLLRHGVRPRELDLLFARLGLDQSASGPEEAARILERHGYRLDPKRLPGPAAEAASGAGAPAVIQIDRLTHQYPDGMLALRGIDLTVRPGEFVALLGANGSGKTTLVQHLNGLLHPSSGSCRIGGKEARAYSLAELGQRVGYVFQNPDVMIFSDTVADEVRFGLRNRGLSEEQQERRCRAALEAVGLEALADADPFALPKGGRQRVAVASVLALEPEILVLDEPTTGLDHAHARTVLDLLRELNRKGHTILMITHALGLAAEYARRCLLLGRGELLADGAPRQVLADANALALSGLEPPDILALGQRLGAPTLTLDELASCLVRPAS